MSVWWTLFFIVVITWQASDIRALKAKVRWLQSPEHERRILARHARSWRAGFKADNIEENPFEREDRP